MRIVVLALLLAACANVPTVSSTLTCQNDYDRCVRREASMEACEVYRAACVEQANAIREERDEKKREFEEFKRDREEAGT